MLLKYRPEDKAAKKERLLKRAQAEAEGKTAESKKPIVVKYGLNHITYLIEQVFLIKWKLGPWCGRHMDNTAKKEKHVYYYRLEMHSPEFFGFAFLLGCVKKLHFDFCFRFSSLYIFFPVTTFFQ